MQALGPRIITLDRDVLQADGGTRTAAITGAYVALHRACSLLLQRGLLSTCIPYARRLPLPAWAS